MYECVGKMGRRRRARKKIVKVKEIQGQFGGVNINQMKRVVRKGKCLLEEGEDLRPLNTKGVKNGEEKRSTDTEKVSSE